MSNRIFESSQQDTTKGRGYHDDESSLGSVDHGHGGEDEHDDHIEEEKEEKKSLKARLQAVQEVTALVQVGYSDCQWKELANLRLNETVQGDTSHWSKPPVDTKPKVAF